MYAHIDHHLCNLAFSEIGHKGILRGDARTSHSARMQVIVLSVVGVIVLAFCALPYLAARSWRKIATWKWIAGLLLLVPHFLLLWCIEVSLRNGNAPQGSARWNEAFGADVYMMFILPLPALLGSLGALLMFRFSRPENRPDAQGAAIGTPAPSPLTLPSLLPQEDFRRAVQSVS